MTNSFQCETKSMLSSEMYVNLVENLDFWNADYEFMAFKVCEIVGGCHFGLGGRPDLPTQSVRV